MADEQSRPPFNKPSPIPKEFGWDKLVKLDGDELEIHYRHTLEELGKKAGITWSHLPQGTKQGSRSGQAAPVGRRPDR